MCETCDVAKEIIEHTQLYTDDALQVANAIISAIDYRQQINRVQSREEMILGMTKAAIDQLNRKMEISIVERGIHLNVGICLQNIRRKL